MFNRKRAYLFVGGVVSALIASVAVADFLTGTSLSDYVGGGVTLSHVSYNSQDIPSRDLEVTIQKNTDETPARLMGSISYSTMAVDAYSNPIAENALYEVKFEVRPNGGAWSTVCDITAPNGAITTVGSCNQFQYTYIIADMPQGGEYLLTTWASQYAQPCTKSGGYLSGQ